MKKDPMNVVFMGTPEIGSFALKALLDNKRFQVVGVVCQPDRPIGRKKEIVFSPVKELAIKNNIKLFQPNKLMEIYDDLNDLKPDLFVTCAFGQFIPTKVLQIPKYGCINAHASLLPKYRGGAPIHWAIINGEEKTGITLMKTIKEMDAGDYFVSYEVNIDKNDNTSSLFKKMNEIAYSIIFNELEKIVDNIYLPIVQDNSKVSFAYNISREQEKLCLDYSAMELNNWVRGLSDKPGAYLKLNDKIIKIFKCNVTNNKSNKKPGEIIKCDKTGIYFATKDYDLQILEFQIEGKKRTNINEFSSYSFFKIGSYFE